MRSPLPSARALRPLPLLLALLLPPALQAQEFNCSVSVIAPQVANAQPRIWKNLESSIRDFMNNRRWTNLNYAPAERIDVNLLVNISSQPAPDRFEGTMQVSYSRPVFGSDYLSPIIELVDNDVKFNYIDNTVVEFTPDRYIGNLSSILGFYAYFILGLDADSFSELGGTAFYNLAQQVVNNAESSSESGWKGFEGVTNRFWLIDNQLQATFRPFRECLYKYHRLGMDVIGTDAAEGQRQISAAIEALKSVHQAKPGSYNLQVFFNAKSEELVEIFKPLPPQDKAKMYNTLQVIDPGNISKYQVMMRGS